MFEKVIRSIVFTLILVSTLLLSGCAVRSGGKPFQEPAPTTEEVVIRFTNTGDVAIEDLVVYFPESELSIGPLASGETSEYITAPNGVYRYAAYKITIDGKTYEQPVRDWVGEEPVAGQAFSWKIDADPERPEVVMLLEATIDR